MLVFILVDFFYLLALPFLIIFALISRIGGHPRRKDLLARLGYGEDLSHSSKRILLHAVSVGEVNTLRKLIPKLIENNYEVVVCVTTDTGIKRATELFSQTCVVTRFPFDFSFAVRRFLKRIKPTVIALVELEVWPNFIGQSDTLSIPVVIINGRLSERSYDRYKLAKPFLRKTFSRIAAIGMQTEEYAHRVMSLGGNNVSVQGTMKWDNVDTSKSSIEGADDLASNLGIDAQKPLIVAGSTAPEEHKLFQKVLPKGMQLLCAPRKPEWFDDAAKTLTPCNRRTSSESFETNYFLLDTIGELDKAYSLADIVIIGRSFVPMHGSDPVPPIALGKSTIIGPNYSDFKEMVHMFADNAGIIICSEIDLGETITSLFEQPELLEESGLAGQKVIDSQQGASKKYLKLIVDNTP